MVRKIRSGRLTVREPMVRGTFSGRRRPLRERIKYFFIIMMRLAIIVGVLMSVGFLAKSFHYFIFRSGYLALTDVVVEGVGPDMEKEIIALSGLSASGASNLLAIRTSEVASRIAAHPKLRNLRVTKHYPHTITIVAEERKPVAIVNAEKMYLIDSEAVVVEQVSLKKAKASGLPYVTGVSQGEVRLGRSVDGRAILNCLDFIRTLKEANPHLYRSLSEVNVNEHDEITAYFERGTEIRLGKGEVAAKLPELDAFIQKVGSLAKIQYADFRFNRQIVYKPAIR